MILEHFESANPFRGQFRALFVSPTNPAANLEKLFLVLEFCWIDEAHGFGALDELFLPFVLECREADIVGLEKFDPLFQADLSFERVVVETFPVVEGLLYYEHNASSASWCDRGYCPEGWV